MNRRGFLGSILALGAAPAIVSATSLMPIWVPADEVVVPLTSWQGKMWGSQWGEEVGEVKTTWTREGNVITVCYSIAITDPGRGAGVVRF